MTMQKVELWGIFAGLALAGAVAAAEPPVLRGAEAGAPVTPTVWSGDLRELPKTPDWQPGDAIKEIPRRSTRPPVSVTPPAPELDALLAVQERQGGKAPDAIGTPILNFAGGGFTGVNPPDTVGDVGPNHYIQMINGNSGAVFRIYNKAGTLLAGPTNLETLGTGNCASGLGDPIVLYDQLAGRWLMSEFSNSGNRLCVYISQTGDPVSGGWFAYQFTATNFPDYPKYGVWPDAYYVGTNENSPAAYALQRSAMLAGTAATAQRFTAPALSGFPFQMVQPADADGSTPPPAGAPGLFFRHKDSEAHGSPGAADTVEYFQFHVDFTTPANSTFTGPISVNVTEFDSDLCGLSSFSCIPQPSGTSPLDPLREVVMHRAQYRNRGTHEVVVGSFATDVTGTNRAGVRWFELRKSGANPWTLFQEGTYSLDTTNRWMSSIAMDGSGNIALAYNVSSSSVFPGLRYTGRIAGDPAGTMGAEQTAQAGSGSNGSIRYGDYAALNVDPADECTFWFTGEYNAASQWSTRVATFKFPVGECTPVPVELQRFNIE
jgi:hypothetical protein